MNGTYLRFYTHENRKVHGALFYEWLLDQARKAGIQGGTAFKAMAGYGRHGVMHESKFFELAGDLTVEVEFIVTVEEAEKLLAIVRAANVQVFFARFPAEFSVLDGEH
jgi:PII-like signaling protein